MRIVISHVYSADNKGDAALLGVLIEEAKKQFPGVDLTILTMDSVGRGETFDGVPVRHSFMYYVNKWSRFKPLWLLYGLVMMPYTLVVAWYRRRLHIRLPMPENWNRLVSIYADTDLIIAVGGGYMRTKIGVGSMYDFILLLHPLLLSRVLRKPTVLYTQSVGPLHRAIERRMFASVLNRCVKLAIIREDKSMKLLDSIGVHNTVRSVDAGFLLRTTKADAVNVDITLPKGRPIIGVTARQWLDATGQQAYEQAMAETLDYLVRKHRAYVVFIPQVTSEFLGDDDRVTSQAVLALMSEQKHAVVLAENYTYRQIKTIYDRLDFLLGTRFHSVIFSLTSLVPALAIEYEHKTSGIMHDLGLDKWVVKMEDVKTKSLCPKMDQLIEQSVDYKAHLQTVLPAYVTKAHEAIEFVAEAYQATVAAKR